MSTPETKNRMMSRPEAAERLGMKPQTLAAWAVTGRNGLRFVKVGRAVKYRESDIEQWLREREGTSTSAISARN